MQLLITVVLVFSLLHPSFESPNFVTNLKASICGALGKGGQENDIENCIRSELENGNEKFGIPSLNPLEISKTKIKLDNNILCLGDITGSVEIQDLKCEGLTQWNITNRSTKIARFYPLLVANSLSGVFETIKCQTKYSDLKLTFKNKEYVGSGEIKFTAKNLVLDVSFDYKVFESKVVHANVRPNLELMESFKITGLNSDSDLSEEISKKVLNDASTLIRENSSKMKDCLLEVFSGNSCEDESFITYLINKCK